MMARVRAVIAASIDDEEVALGEGAPEIRANEDAADHIQPRAECDVFDHRYRAPSSLVRRRGGEVALDQVGGPLPGVR